MRLGTSLMSTPSRELLLTRSDFMAKRRNRGRPVTGILLLDKPCGATSNGALQQVKRVFQARKAGHTGSLDPLASGLLPICLGEATKLSAFLLDADKRYWVRIRLGVTTATGDAEGAVVDQSAIPHLTGPIVNEVLGSFLGTTEQIPPMYSALKHKGERLYKLAREGVEVERKPRQITIHKLQLEELGDGFLDVDVHCTKGTYIRTLAEDIGRALGCGAHVEQLRRTEVGPYRLVDAVAMSKLEEQATSGLETLDQLLQPLDSALSHIPAVRLDSDSAFYLSQGQSVFVANAPTAGLVRIFRGQDRFLGVGQILPDGKVAPKRLLNA